MSMTTLKNLACFGVFLGMLASCEVTMAQPATDRPQAPTPLVALPNPVAVFLGAEFYQAGGRDLVRYRYQIDNFTAYPSSLFVAAPKLPPCGANNNSSRTWVEIYNQYGKRLYGFCALKTPAELGQLWFALETAEIPPSWIYIEFNDRLTNTKYKSNLVETTM